MMQIRDRFIIRKVFVVIPLPGVKTREITYKSILKEHISFYSSWSTYFSGIAPLNIETCFICFLVIARLTFH